MFSKWPLIYSCFSDRFRTAVNVLGDAFGAGIVSHLSTSELLKMDEDNTAQTEVTDDLQDINTVVIHKDKAVDQTASESRLNDFTQREHNALLNDNTRFKSYSGIKNDGFVGETEM